MPAVVSIKIADTRTHAHTMFTIHIYTCARSFFLNDAHTCGNCLHHYSVPAPTHSQVSGAFGLQPNASARQLRVAPAWNPAVDGATLSNFQFLSHTFAVTLNEGFFEVKQDGKLIASQSYYMPLLVML